MLPVVGQIAPDFTLPNQNGVSQTLSSFRGSWVLLYFYPKDDTPGCTKEACSFRDNFPHFQASAITVLGISTDSVNSHKHFAEKYQLPFLLFADEQKTVVKQYGVWQQKRFLGKAYTGVARTSFLINPRLEIVKIYEHVVPKDHAALVLRDYRTLSTTS